MSLLPPRRDGYCDKNGVWQRTKFCFVDCGDRCTCREPFEDSLRARIERAKPNDGVAHLTEKKP